MRMYALLLGVILTSGYGYAAQVAVASATAGREPGPDPEAAAVLGHVWYGGTLDPIIVESRGRARVAERGHRLLERVTVRCADADAERSGFHAMF
jgi:hypothetical protein